MEGTSQFPRASTIFCYLSNQLALFEIIYIYLLTQLSRLVI